MSAIAFSASCFTQKKCSNWFRRRNCWADWLISRLLNLLIFRARSRPRSSHHGFAQSIAKCNTEIILRKPRVVLISSSAYAQHMNGTFVLYLGHILYSFPPSKSWCPMPRQRSVSSARLPLLRWAFAYATPPRYTITILKKRSSRLHKPQVPSLCHHSWLIHDE